MCCSSVGLSFSLTENGCKEKKEKKGRKGTGENMKESSVKRNMEKVSEKSTHKKVRRRKSGMAEVDDVGCSSHLVLPRLFSSNVLINRENEGQGNIKKGFFLIKIYKYRGAQRERSQNYNTGSGLASLCDPFTHKEVP